MDVEDHADQWPALRQRILDTLRFFDLQNTPLTLLELHRFLISDVGGLKTKLNDQWELKPAPETAIQSKIGIDQLLHCLERECKGEVVEKSGYYALLGSEEKINTRLANYRYGIKREQLVKKYVGGLRHVPFVRGIALGGSQALGLQKPESDIDLLIITDSKFLFLGRMFVTAYFQVLGKRRHGKYIANRFCLNHYLSWPKTITHLKNLYTAMEYARLRPLVYGDGIEEYQKNNLGWISQFFPNWEPVRIDGKEAKSPIQYALEKIFNNAFGRWCEGVAKDIQLLKIRERKFIVVLDDELSFHPDSKQQYLLQPFFERGGSGSSASKEQDSEVSNQLLPE